MNKTERKHSLKHLRKPSHSFAHTNFSFKIKTDSNHRTIDDPIDVPNSQFMVTKRAKLYSKGHSRSAFRTQDENRCAHMSNFQLLKKQAELLQQSRILKSSQELTAIDLQIPSPMQRYQLKAFEKKSNFHALTETNHNFHQNNYVINNEFLSSKKISILDKCRQNIKKLHRNRLKTSTCLDKTPTTNCDVSSFMHSFPAKRANSEMTISEDRGQCSIISQSVKKGEQVRPSSTFKRESGSSVAKRYFQAGGQQGRKSRTTKSHSTFYDPNLKMRAMEISSRETKRNNEIVIICL